MTTSGTWLPPALTIVLAVLLAVAALGAGVAKLAGVPLLRTAEGRSSSGVVADRRRLSRIRDRS